MQHGAVMGLIWVCFSLVQRAAAFQHHNTCPVKRGCACIHTMYVHTYLKATCSV